MSRHAMGCRKSPLIQDVQSQRDGDRSTFVRLLMASVCLRMCVSVCVRVCVRVYVCEFSH